jgi:ribosome-associated protein
VTPRSAEAVARLAARAALDKRAVDLVVLDLQGMSSLADFFLVCTGRSTAQMDTIAEAIAIALRADGIRVRHREGTAESGWLLLDYGDVVVHIFGEEPRAFYGLERLWGDAPVLSVERGVGSRD